MRADSVHVRHASVEVQVKCINVVIGVLVVHVVTACCTRRSSFTYDAVVHRTLPFFCIWRYSVYTPPSVTVNFC